jgi:hypothetical protein
MEKQQREIAISGNFETPFRCHGNRKFKIEHAVTKALVKSTTYHSRREKLVGFFGLNGTPIPTLLRIGRMFH